VNLACGPDGAVRPCQRCGIYLVAEGDVRTALLLRGAAPEFGHNQVSLQLVSTDPQTASVAAAEIRTAALDHNVFRGQVLSFGQEIFGHGQTLLQFHRRPVMSADQLILAPETLAEVRRQVVEVARHKERLLAAGQHLKRGLLLYGPPGVGKTHTVRYLTSSLVGTTVLQLTGNALHLIAEACSVARALQPAMLIVEDVDLIAEDRGMHPGQHPLLFQLLNEMDGLAEDADVVFVLTTNRADLLEPALAARPGRVDQAVALELPDVAGRRALFELYRGELRVDTSGLDDVLARSEGVTASFLKELLRRAALLAATRTAEDEELAVSSADLTAALDELLDTRNAMTRTLLGSGAD
jgi:ATP-dependent 26S proteasome regulatory subunit